MISTGVNTGSAGGGDFSFDDYEWEGYGILDNNVSQDRNEQLKENANNQQKDSGFWDYTMDLADKYIQFKAVDNINQDSELAMNESGEHKTTDSKSYLESQKARYGDYQQKMEDIQNTPPEQLTEYQRQMMLSQNNNGGLPNITGNKTLDIGVYIMLFIMLFKVIKTV